MSEIKVYLKDWSFNAGVVGFMSIFGNTVEDIKGAGINVESNYITFDKSLLDGFGERYREHLIRYFLTDNLLDKQIKLLEDEESVKKLKKQDWEKSDFKVFYKIFENVNIKSLDELKSNGKSASEAIRKAKNDKYFENAQESDELLTSRFINYGGRNAVQIAGVNDIIQAINKCVEYLNTENSNPSKNSCSMCGNKDAQKKYMSSVNTMGGYGGSSISWFYKDIYICSVCEIVYRCMLSALSKAANSIYYFANINTSVKNLFECNMNLKTVEIGANALLSYIERIKKLAELDIERRNFNSFQFIKTEQNGLIGKPGYNLYQYHITQELMRFFSEYPPPSGSYAHDQGTWIYIYESWLEKALVGTLGWADAATLFNAGINKKTSVLLFYAVIYISAYRKITGGNMDVKKETNVIGWGGKCGSDLKIRLETGKAEGLAYALLGALKTENMNEFLNSYMRAMMSYDLPPTFPTELLEDKERFIQFGYAFLAGLLQGDRKNDDKKGTDNNSNATKEIANG
ncbi:MAG: hypothetical protein LBH05_00290 [Deferribacteraceae bacterium]|jgi:CRISPR-associated protein Cst1|nr:hypothetical protein [Deferribacteraceae bacterium]